MGALTALLPWIILPIVGIAGLLARRPLLRLYRIARVPLTPIGLLPLDQLTSIVGRVSAAPLRSPLSASACAFWQLEVQLFNPKVRTTIFKQSSAAPLELDDGTGCIQVWLTDADLILDEDSIFPNRRDKTLPSEMETALAQLGVTTRGPLGLRSNLIVHERYITGAEDVFVLGHATRNGTQLVMQSTADMPLVIADQNKGALLRKLTWQIGIGTVGLLLVLGFYIWMLW